jgi:hypothetical protein
MGMGDWYLFTNQLRDICEKIMIKTYFCEWNVDLIGSQKKGIKRKIPLILIKGDYVEMKKRLYVGNKSSARECVKVMELCVFCFAFIFLLCLHFPLRMIIFHLCLM